MRKMYCNKCGKEIGNAMYCPYCGNKQKEFVDNQSVIKRTYNFKKYITMFIILFILIVGIIVYELLKSRENVNINDDSEKLTVEALSNTVEENTLKESDENLEIEQTLEEQEERIPVVKREEIRNNDVHQISEYDERGNIVYEEREGVGISYTYEYGEEGNVLTRQRITNYKIGDPEIIDTKYDEYGNEIYETNGFYTYRREYKYTNGRAEQFIEYYSYGDQHEEFNRLVKYSYDEQGNLILEEEYLFDMTMPTYTTKWEYNERKQLISVERDEGEEYVDIVEYDPDLHTEDNYSVYDGQKKQNYHKEYNSKGYLLLYQIYSDGDVLNDYYSYNFEYDEGNIIKEIWFINNNFYQEIERTFY